MKKILFIIIVLIFLLTACGEKGSPGQDPGLSPGETAIPGTLSGESRETGAAAASSQAPETPGETLQETLPEAPQENLPQISGPASAVPVVPVSGAGQELPVPRSGAAGTAVPEQVFADGESFSAALRGYAFDPREGEGLRLYLENKTEKPLQVSAEELLANGCAFAPSYHITLEPGQGRETTVRFPVKEMARYGFRALGDVRLKLKFREDSSGEEEYALFTAETSEAEEGRREFEEKTAAWRAGFPVYRDDRIAVTAVLLEKGEFENHLILWAENRTGGTVSIRGESLAVNGEKIPFFLEKTVPGNAASLWEGAFLSEDLEVHRVDEIREMALTFRIAGEGFEIPEETVVIPAGGN